MKHENLSQALDQISDGHIAEAAKGTKRSRLPWIGAVAAALALALVFHGTGLPLTAQAQAVAEADYPQYQWVYRGDEMDPIREQLSGFFAQSMQQTLSGTDGENQAYSPANLYMALSIAAELTEGDTRQQLLNALNAESIEALRRQTNTLWNACYNDGKAKTILANSIWLDQDLTYSQSVMDTLAEDYYTSVYSGDFGSAETNKAIANWLDNQTGGLLKSKTQEINLPPETVLTVCSTVFYRANWTEASKFDPRNNTSGIFNSPSGDRDVTYMSHKEFQTNYYWGEDYGAIHLGLVGGCDMWFILPDEGKTVDDVLAAGEYTQMLMGASHPDIATENYRYAKVNLFVPVFDIQASGDLKEDVQALGITDIFDPGKSDFSVSVKPNPGSYPPFAYVAEVNQATRVAISEDGVTAASYIEMGANAGSAPPPDDIIDFVLCRPFLFVIVDRYGIPLFAGVVNEP